MNTRFGSPKSKEKMSKRLCERVCGHRGRFRTRAGSSLCMSQASQRQSWAFVSSGGILGRRSTRTEAGSFFDLGMPSTSCIFDVFTLGSSACSETSSLFFCFSMSSYGLKNRPKAAKPGQPKKSRFFKVRN